MDADRTVYGVPVQRLFTYEAQSRALRALVRDLSAAMIPDRGPSVGRDLRSVFLVEMGGQTSATVIDDADAASVGARFEAEHANLLADVGHAKSNIWPIEIPQLDPASQRRQKGLLDMRYALVVWMDSSLVATIHNTEADLDAAEAELKERYGWEIDRQEVTYHTHVILIPPRGSGQGPAPPGRANPGRRPRQPASTTDSEGERSGGSRHAHKPCH